MVVQNTSEMRHKMVSLYNLTPGCSYNENKQKEREGIV